MHFTAADIRRLTPWSALISKLEVMLTDETIEAPPRHHHELATSERAPATLLLMPAWQIGGYLGVKQVTVFPENYHLNLPSLTSTYQLYCCRTGRFLASFDGNEITMRRTAAASALASVYLSRSSTESMLLIGAGKVGRQLVAAHRSVRPITRVWVYDQVLEAAHGLVAELQSQGMVEGAIAQVCTNSALPEVASAVDLISCATLATQPVVLGDWVRPGTHIDLVGSFTLAMREADNALMAKAELYADFRTQALAESGELIQPIREGAITADSVLADLPVLCADQLKNRGVCCDANNAITAFKAVGDAREDLITAVLVYESALAEGGCDSVEQEKAG